MYELHQDESGMHLSASVFVFLDGVCSGLGATERNSSGNTTVWSIWSTFIWPC